MTQELTVPFSYPNEATLVEFSVIKINDDRTDMPRSRKDFSHVESLAESIQRYGLLHPPLLSADNILVAGETRIRAMQLLQTPLFPVLFRESLSPSEIAELELIENFKRKNLEWQEAVLNIDKCHKLKVAEGRALKKKWLMAETGSLFGYHVSYVSNALKIAEFLKIGDAEITECKGILDAYKILQQRRLNETVAEKARRTSVAIGLSAPPTASKPGTFMIDLNGIGGTTVAPSSVESPIVEPTDAPLPSLDTSPLTEVDFSTMFYFGDSIEVLKSFPPESIDHCVTDPPYAIDMKNLDTNRDLHRTVNEHQVDENFSFLEQLIPAVYRVLKPDSFFVFWYDEEHKDFLKNVVEAAGFTVQRWPLVWVKTHTCRNSAPHHNWTKATEVAMVCRKGKPKLKKPMTKNYILADGLAERKMFDHPFIKPRDLWNFILDGVAFSGQTILDPCAGQMSAPRAFINAGMRPVAIEKSAYHFMRGVGHMEKLYKEMTLGKCRIINDPRVHITPEMIVPPNEETID